MLKNSAFAFLWVVSMLLLGCASLTPDYEQPDLQLTGLKLLPPKGLEQRFRLSFRIINPNNMAFSIDGLSFKLRLQNVDVASGVSNDAFVLEPLGESFFDVDVSASLFNSGRVLLDIIHSKPEELAYEIDGKIFTSMGLWRSIPIARSGVIGFR